MLGAQIAPWSCGNSPRVDPGTLPISMPANAEAKQICREEEADGQAAENFRNARRKCARDIRPSDRLSSREEFRGKGARQAVHASDSRARWAPGNRDAGAVPEEEGAEDLHLRFVAFPRARLDGQNPARERGEVQMIYIDPPETCGLGVGPRDTSRSSRHRRHPNDCEAWSSRFKANSLAHCAGYNTADR
jgi:hypothetical protein